MDEGLALKSLRKGVNDLLYEFLKHRIGFLVAAFFESENYQEVAGLEVFLLLLQPQTLELR
jgi:hypothetical protein